MSNSSGGYDEGYLSCSCFWGRSPGSLVRSHLESIVNAKGLRVLDLGCGEGKNANAFAEAGADVIAVDSSRVAIDNGMKAFPAARIEWVHSDAKSYLENADTFDVVIMYGLLHCLGSAEDVRLLIDCALQRTHATGTHIVAAFNDGPHDLSAHPGFKPLLLSHEFYIGCYAGSKIVSASDSILEETHPHNNIRHFHSLTRMVAVK
jgi:tellurite methyltransferase